MNYVGEHLLPNQIGHFFLIFSFVASIVATIAYFFATQRSETNEFNSWRTLARGAWAAHGLSVLIVMATLFTVLFSKWYEYRYAWANIDDELSQRYVFAAFWKDQEGSFLLWMFWHTVLGSVLIWKAKKWETSTMAVLAAIEVFLSSMIVGFYINGSEHVGKFGSNPLDLLRNTMNAPIFSQADYLSKINGNGLNPLLQNYWMTIHPPTLFLGFASTSIPFCFAIAGLWTNRHKEWLKPALRWALFSGTILGIGILMGGAWAYEALSFGGYWAWDPVENMSLVPWLVMIAGLHTNLIANATGRAIKSSYFYYILSFVLVLYSTFLTRSGILGNTSVHAFTELGLEWQLVAFQVFFLVLGIALLVWKNKEIPTIVQEEEVSSREFWMFIGTMVLLFSSVLMIFTTSIPVYNKVSEWFGHPLNLAPPTDVIGHYNKTQLWIGVFIGLLTGFAQFTRYREINFQGYSKKFLTHIGISVAITIVLTFLASLWIEAKAWQYMVLLFTGLFAIVANAEYFIVFLRGNMKVAGSTFSHIGFGIMIVGIMASGLNKTFISTNRFAQEGLIEGFSEEDYAKNIVLLKGAPMMMSGYEVTYLSDTVYNHTRDFIVNYKKKDDNGQIVEEFNLSPNVLYDKNFTKIAANNPSTKHYWNKDIFTNVTSLPKADLDPEYRKQLEDSLKYLKYEGIVGDTIFTSKYYGVIESLNLNPKNHDYKPEKGDLAVGAKIAFRRLNSDSVWSAEPVTVLRENTLMTYPAQVQGLNLKVRLPEQILDRVFANEEKLAYKPLIFKRGEAQKVGNLTITFSDFNKNASHPNYEPKPEDIAVNAILNIKDSKGKEYTATPLFLIRDNRPFNIKAEVAALGLHLRFTGLNPANESAEISVAQADAEGQKIPLEIAENARQAQYIVMQAIIFPGINYFWIGSILMMSGLGLSLFYRKKAAREE
jgi:cytochrome c-type biogenesis protein CcmF